MGKFDKFKNVFKFIGKGALKSIPVLGGFADQIVDVLGESLTPEQKSALRMAKEDNRFKLEELEFEHQSRQIEAVNATMQAEAKSEHFMQWAWRPTIGFTFAGVIINNYILIPWFSSVPMIMIPAEIWNSMLLILGVSAGLRGWKKVQEVKEN